MAAGRPRAHTPKRAVQLLAREDEWSARLFHRVLVCDVAALLAIDHGAASAWLMTWSEGAHSTEHRTPISGALAATVARRLPSCEEAVPWPGGLHLSATREN